MKQLLWINACMRGPEQSRTFSLCRTFLEEWEKANPGAQIWVRDLSQGELTAMDHNLSRLRDQAVEQGKLDDPLLSVAQEMARADRIVIGAPYWDLSFPARLKVYLEWASTLGVTFRYTENGVCQGLCRGEKLLYITTAGGPIQGQNFGFEYIKHLGAMLGIPRSECVFAENLDVWNGPGEENLKNAADFLTKLAKSW